MHRYDRHQSYEWNFAHAPDPVPMKLSPIPGDWRLCGLPVDSPLGVAAGPLLNGKWCLYYASLGFDVVTYKSVRSKPRECYDLPNLQPVTCGQLTGKEDQLPASDEMNGSWAVSFGMPSKAPDFWRDDVRATRDELPNGNLLSVSVVGTVQEGWSLEQLGDDYADCAEWATASGADLIEANFSCPNVSTCDGQLYQHPDDARRVAERIRARIPQTPLIIKVGHIETEDVAAQLVDALAPSIDALAMTNSIATTVRTPAGELLFAGQRRGICGAATLTASLRQTELVRRIVDRAGADLNLIGVGGAGSADNVRQYLASGADAVHMATAAMVNPAVAAEIRNAW